MRAREQLDASLVAALKSAMLFEIKNMDCRRWLSDMPGCVAEAAKKVRKEFEANGVPLRMTIERRRD